jgi:transposase
VKQGQEKAKEPTATAAVSQEREPEFSAWVAIDWADQKHYWSCRVGTGSMERGTLDNTPEAVEAWFTELLRRIGTRPVAVALEQRKGALVVLLSKYEQLYLFPVHPATLAKYRDTWYPSGSKDDRKDADLLLEILLQHRHRLWRLNPETTEMRLLQFQVENRRKLVDERTALSNKLKDTLKIYYPQIVRWFEDVTTELVRELLTRWPSLQVLQTARRATLEKFLRGHRWRDEEKLAEQIADIEKAIPATSDRAVLESAQCLVRAWVPQLKVLQAAIRELEQQIRELACQQEDWVLFDSLPGAGAALAPRLMAALGTRRERFRSASELQSFTGIAPVKEASGNSVWVHFRWACPKFLRQTFHEWAACSIPRCAWARAYYDRQKAKGKGHHAAVRALAFKWIRILYRCWEQREPYQEHVYLASLAQRSLPLGSLLAAVKMP